MKKTSKIFLSLMMTLALIFGIAGCSEEKVTLSPKTVNGLSFQVPDDFSDFAEKQGAMLATNEKSTASIAVSEVGYSDGHIAEDWTQDSYQELIIPAGYTDVNFIEFDNSKTISDFPAVYTHFTAKKSDGDEIETYNYMIYYLVDDSDPLYQSITFAVTKNDNSSLKSNIETIKNSLKVELE